MRCSLVLVIAAHIVAAVPRQATAQLLTQHVKGSAGLKAGSQPPPGGYVVAPLFYFYHTDTLRDRDGQALPVTADLNTSFFGAGYSRVTTKKILGASYGFTFLSPIGANNRIQGTEIDFNPGAGLTDSVLVPASLGWHGARADAIAAFTIYAPTGRYHDGAHDNTGLGMWGFEPGIGATVYVDAKRRYHAATLATFNFQSKKEDSETKVGTQMNLEGGAGGDFLEGGLTLGVSYYASFKLDNDQFDGVLGTLIRGRNRAFAVGPEATLAIALRDKVRGFVTVRYFWEVYARTATQGGAFLLQATFLTKPIAVP
jgi:hypothetical protein